MRAYFNMPTSDFVAQLRDIAIKANARPQVIDCIDALLEPVDTEELQALKDKAKDQAIDDCLDILNKEGLEKDIGLTKTQLEQITELLESCRP